MGLNVIYNVAGQIIDTETTPDPPKAPDVSAFKSIIRAKAKRLSKAGQYLESLSLLKTIGE